MAQEYCAQIGTTIKSKLDNDDIDFFYQKKIRTTKKRYLFQNEWTETFWTSIKVEKLCELMSQNFVNTSFLMSRNPERSVPLENYETSSDL